MGRGSGIALVTILLLSIGAGIMAEDADAAGDPDNPVAVNFVNELGGSQYMTALEYGETVPEDVAEWLDKWTWRTADGVTWTPAWSSTTAGSYTFYQQPEPEEPAEEEDTSPAVWIGIAGGIMGAAALAIVLLRRH